MLPLITSAQLKRHLQIVHSLDDDKIAEIVVHASHVIKDYLKKTDTELSILWNNASPPEVSDAIEDHTIPGAVQAATLMAAGALYANREGYEGSGSVSSFSLPDPLSKTIKMLLHRSRDPAMA